MWGDGAFEELYIVSGETMREAFVRQERTRLWKTRYTNLRRLDLISKGGFGGIKQQVQQNKIVILERLQSDTGEWIEGYKTAGEKRSYGLKMMGDEDTLDKVVAVSTVLRSSPQLQLSSFSSGAYPPTRWSPQG